MRFFGTSRGYRTEEVNLTFAATVLVALGTYDRTFPVASLRAGQTVSVEPRGAIPAGYKLLNSWCAANGVLTVRMEQPLLALGASFNLPVKLIVFE